MRSLIGAVLLSATLLASPFGRDSALAHEGHDHGDQPTVAAPIAPRAHSVTETLELVAVARGGQLTIHLDRLQTNEPVPGAKVEVQGPDGSSAEAEATEPGTYRIAAPWSTKDGEHEVLITVTLDGASDVFPITLDIHAAEAAPAAPKTSWFVAPAFASGLKDRLGQDGIWIVATASFVAGIGCAFLLRRRARPAAMAIAILALAAPVGMVRAHGDGDHSHEMASGGPAKLGTRDQAQRAQEGFLFVPKPTQRLLAVRTLVTEAATHYAASELPGRIIADPNGSGMVQSSLGGRLSPPPGGFPRLGTRVKAGQVLAYATPPIQAIDTSDMLQKQGELDQQIAIVEKRVTRFESLAKTGIVSQVQLDEAKTELRGLRERRAGLDRIRRQPEPLIAPIDGVVAESTAVAGLMAQPSAVVFQIMDPKRLLVEALSFQALYDVKDASARTIAGQAVKLKFLGAGLADRNQTIPVHFAIEGDAGALRPGQFVTVFARREDGLAGIAVPRASVVRGSNGQSLVFEKTAPERFEPREVRTEPLDGDRVLIASGIDTGKRIVTGGAELLNQVR